MVAGCDLVAVSAHKFGGPKGVGALVVRGGVAVEPLLMGGGQERDRRSGTHNVAGIVAMAAAMKATAASREATVAQVTALRDRLLDGLLSEVDGLRETVPRDRKVAGSAHVCIEGVENEALLFLLDRDGRLRVARPRPAAVGPWIRPTSWRRWDCRREVAAGSLRLSLGWSSTDADIDRVLEVLPEAVARLRRRDARRLRSGPS